jgi:hypothetical protein
VTRRTLAALALPLVLLVACGDDDGGGGDDGDGSSTTEDAAELSTYGAVADIADDLDAAGIPCALEYEGLRDDTREVSLCAVNGEYTELSVWVDASEAAASGAAADDAGDPFVEGANWTVDVETAATAEAVADALGGVARGV